MTTSTTVRTVVGRRELLKRPPLHSPLHWPAIFHPFMVDVHVYWPKGSIPIVPTTLDPISNVQPPPYILHVSSDALPENAPSTLAQLLSTHTRLTPSYIHELLPFGAIYLRTGPPHPRRSPRPTRQLCDCQLPTNTPIYVRVYATPKRHTPLTPLSLLSSCPEFLAICKPAGLPVSPSVDNLRECVLTVAAERFCKNIDHALCITTRLDVATSGVLLIATSPAHASIINQALTSATKQYVVWTQNKPTHTGALRHWYNNAAERRRGPLKTPLIAAWTPQQPPAHAGEKWVLAELYVMTVKRVSNLWQTDVRLVTGRTHQIRMQFAASGCPVVGDTKYGPVAGRLLHPAPADAILGEDPSCIGLHAHRLSFTLNHRNYVINAPISTRGKSVLVADDDSLE